MTVSQKGDLVFAAPGDLDTPTGGFAYDKRMIAELRALGWRADYLNLGDGFPHPDALTRAAARAHLLDVPKGRPIVVDGLAFGVLPEAAEALSRTHPLVALVHHPLALETGTTPDQATALRGSERTALSFARNVIANSPLTARTLMADYAVPQARITIAPPGTDRPSVARRNSARPGTPVALLTVGAIVPRKGHDVLAEALATLIDLPWRLTIVGDCSRDPACVGRLRRAIEAFRLGPRVTIEDATPTQRLAALYAAADLFVLASHYEGFGMAYAEAIAYGLPVVGTTGGAIPDTVPASAGVLVPPGDAVSLAAALRALLEHPAEREQLAAGARAAAQLLPTWRGSAELFSHAIEGAL
ncbi:MAG TPA: glycosyltransferase family 4 protein [Xanthobacteraceae bacterium]|nr:glycosyltransferase family 4 protein [Xanthobacteraceae bacterium]